jgi:hypothetical protein
MDANIAYMLSGFIVGMIIGQFLKMTFRKPGAK